MWCSSLLLVGSIVLTPRVPASREIDARMVTECNCNCVCSIRLVEPVRTVCGISWFPRRNCLLRARGAQALCRTAVDACWTRGPVVKPVSTRFISYEFLHLSLKQPRGVRHPGQVRGGQRAYCGGFARQGGHDQTMQAIPCQSRSRRRSSALLTLPPTPPFPVPRDSPRPTPARPSPPLPPASHIARAFHPAHILPILPDACVRSGDDLRAV